VVAGVELITELLVAVARAEVVAEQEILLLQQLVLLT
jgi:hypothetical protein